MERLHLVGYSDGACKIPGKPGRYPGGWGAVVINSSGPTTLKWVAYGGEKKTTNNEMELMGLRRLLDMIPKGCHITIRLDSKYVLQGLVKDGKGELGTRNEAASFIKSKTITTPGEAHFGGWVGGWMKYGWKTKAGKDVANRPLWEEIVEKCQSLVAAGTTLKFEHCKGHSGEEGNELADKLSNLAIPM